MQLTSRLNRSLGLFLLCCLAVVAAIQLLGIMNSTSPYEADRAALWTFFISLFITLGFACSLVWYALKSIIWRRSLVPQRLITSLRLGFLTSAITTLSLFLNSISLFQIWDILPLIIAAILIEFFFQADKRPYASLSS